MAPILPGLSDRPEQLAEVVKAVRAAGATSVWANLLYLRPGTKEHFLEALARDWPEELERYEQLYARGAYLPHSEAEPVRSRVRDLAREHGVRDRRSSEARAAAGAGSALAARLSADLRHTLPANARRDHMPDRR